MVYGHCLDVLCQVCLVADGKASQCDAATLRASALRVNQKIWCMIVFDVLLQA